MTRRGALPPGRGAPSAPGSPALASYAALRLAQLDLEGREFARAQYGGRPSSARPPPRPARRRARGGRAGYWARDYDRAAALRAIPRRFSEAAGGPAVRLALGWTEFRRGRLDEAREPGRASPARPRPTRARPTRSCSPRSWRPRRVTAEGAGCSTSRPAVPRLRAGRGRAAQPRDPLPPRRPSRPRRCRAQPGPRGRLSSPYLGRTRVAKGVALVVGSAGRRPSRSSGPPSGRGRTPSRLGSGRIALERRQWDEATREFVAARDAGSGGGGGGRGVRPRRRALQPGQDRRVREARGRARRGAADPATTPYLLEAWPGGRRRQEAGRTRGPSRSAWPTTSPRAMPRLARWPSPSAARRARPSGPSRARCIERSPPRYPKPRRSTPGELDVAEALLRTGAAAEARRGLEPLPAAAAPGDPRRPARPAARRGAGGHRRSRGSARDVRALRHEFPAAQGAPRPCSARPTPPGGG